MPRGHSLSIYARFSGKKRTSLYISREKGDHYYIQTRHNEFFFPLQSFPRKTSLFSEGVITTRSNRMKFRLRKRIFNILYKPFKATNEKIHDLNLRSQYAGVPNDSFL